jgi:transposase
LENNFDGFAELRKWLAENNIDPNNSVICLETTGVYSERICYYLHSRGFIVWSEAPHKVHRAFTRQSVNDKVAAIQIAEYAYRFFDKITPFEPKQEIVEDLRTLLSTREQLVGQRTANKNALQALERKHFQATKSKVILNEMIKQLDNAIKQIEKELNNIIYTNQTLGPVATAIDTIPGIATLFIANYFVITEGLQKRCSYKELASYLGICPLEKCSGTSVYRKPTSSGHGPSRLRKLLYLGAMSVREHNPKFHNYFVMKQAQGKNEKLILNNIANKLLRVICAISESVTPFFKDYVSVHPKYLKNAI